ncbi:DNA recombination protein RmuC [candidate division GN15 bacterium]|nr:DNA recombination protein RmuC [candidate division GN15 bacterium]
MDSLGIAILVVLAIVLVLLVWLLIRQSKGRSVADSEAVDSALASLKAELIQKQMEGLVSLRESVDSANRLLNERLADGQASLDRRLQIFGEIENRLGQLARQAENIEQVGKNIQALSELLRPPKLRGSLGETLLEHLLAQILPESLFEMQYRFDDGLLVDAAIQVGDRLLPMDSKFPLESFQRLAENPEDSKAIKQFERDMKKHVDAIADKYIRPQDNTTEMALMYIPSESVYAQFVSRTDTGFDYALQRRVIPTSPGHLYGFLSTLAALYKHLGLSTTGELLAESRRLSAGLQAIAEGLEKAVGLVDRVEGSVRSAGNSLNRLQTVHADMTRKLERLRHDQPDTDEGAEISRE